jgi:hypothetical protein
MKRTLKLKNYFTKSKKGTDRSKREGLPVGLGVAVNPKFPEDKLTVDKLSVELLGLTRSGSTRIAF